MGITSWTVATAGGLPEPADEAALVAAAQADPSAFVWLYRAYRLPIYRYVHARVGNDEDAADLTQQVFLQALEALPRYRHRGLPFGAWLFRIARNAITDAGRGRRPSVPLHLAGAAADPPSAHDLERLVLHRQGLACLEAAINALDDTKRELIILRFITGLTSKEIAAILGKSDVAVRVQLSRTLKSLKERCHDI